MVSATVEVVSAKLVIYLGSVPGVGKTHRLLQDGLADQQAGRRVAIAWIETKGRPELEALAARLPCIAPKAFSIGDATFFDMDFEAALAHDADILLVDELAHTNPRGALHVKRWQDVSALRKAGKSVLTACNVYHLETVAPIAERVIEFPVKEIVPMHVLRDADRVVAIDVPLEVLSQRLHDRAILHADDIARGARGIFRPHVVQSMRDLLFRVVDDLTRPNIEPSRISRALALIVDQGDPQPFLHRVAAIADALNLALDVSSISAEPDQLAQTVSEVGATALPFDKAILTGDLRAVQATFLAMTTGKLAERILHEPIDRSLLIADPNSRPLPSTSGVPERLRALRENTAAGALTIYLGSVAGSGKTYAMLDRAHQLKNVGCDVVAALIETHGRSETAAQIGDLECLPRLPNGEMDVEGLIARRPKIALIDELAHTNPVEATYRKRYEDIVALLAAGIDIITTVNIQHFEGVGAAVERLTSTRVSETVPDEILELAADVVFIDVSSDVLQQRLRDGKIYPPPRIETALANFFRYENLVALRELAVRELVRARNMRRFGRPFARIILGVAPRKRELRLIEHVARLAKRLHVKLWIFCITPEPLDPALYECFAHAAAVADATLFTRIAKQPAEALAAIAGSHDLLAIESPRKRRGFFGKPSFAIRLLQAGAKELFVIAPLG